MIYANRAAEKCLDMAPGSLAGKCIREFPILVRAAFRWGYEKVLRDQAPVKYERSVGEDKRLSFNMGPDEKGVVVAVMDISHEWSLLEARRVALLTINTLPDDVFTVRFSGCIVNVNNNACRDTGYSKEELRGMTIRQVLPGLDIGKRDNGGLGAEAQREGVREMELSRRDGSRVPVEVSISEKKVYGVTHYIVIARDITERKRAEEVLAAAHRQTQGIIDNAPAIVYAFDLEERFILANTALAELFNSTPEQMIGKRRREFMPKEDADWHEANDRQVIEAGHALEFEEYSQLKGRSITWLTTKFPLCDARGRVYAVAGISTDISGRKQAEVEREHMFRELADYKGRLESVIENMPAGVLIAVAPSAKIIMGNEWSEKIFGHPYLACDQIGDYIGYRGFHPDGSRVKPHEWPLVRSITNSEIVTGEEIIYERRDGSRRCLLFYSAPIHDEKGKTVAAVMTFLDITDRKRTERYLAEAKAQAELYVDLMGHDINNMHQIALGYLELAREIIPVDEAGRELLEKPVEALERSRQLIQNVRKLQRSRAGGYTPEVYDLGSVIEDVASQYRAVPGRYVKITSAIVKGVMVQADELLKDVFANLIGNAIKHSTGSAFINIRMNRERKDGRQYCLVSIEDNGPGIPDIMKGQIFGRLRRGDTKAKGSGLGLYLVKSLVESYDGRVWVEDRVKGDHTKGSRFVVLLPAVDN